MSLSHHAPPSLSVTSPGPDISRYKLKQLAHWIRDDLDVLIAREGPDVLRPDDVLTLHELFVALRQSTTITALDLRATGIHKAVKDIAGIATRWPARLCDDCDRIIALWTSKFRPLDELRPFLYGRRGRLEGIASATEYSRDALLKRWSQHCPDKIDPRISHRQGDLGFRAGDWWISPLFAHHAGIIGLESVDGGTTYDKNGVYALVLKGISEIDARDEDVFTYCCPINDKGRFHLTAATTKSRERVRVLRSHNVNSLWGPRVGIRYEGLYLVKGWCIRQAKLNDILRGEWKDGDILYEVSLQRQDPVPIDEVTRRPTNMEMDDYAEYKRLRKLHHGDKRKGPGILPMPPKMAPPLSPVQVPASPNIVPRSLLCNSPSGSRKTTFMELAFDTPKASHDSDNLPATDVASPSNVPGPQDSFCVPRTIDAQAIPAKDMNTTATSSDNVWLVSNSTEKQVRYSLASSTRSTTDDLKEIIPWIELEAAVPSPIFSNALAVVDHQSAAKPLNRLEVKAAELNPVKYARRLGRDLKRPSDLSLQSHEAGEEGGATKALNLWLHSAKPMRANTKEKGGERHFIDGAEYSADEEANGFHASSMKARHFPSSSAYGILRLHSRTPVRQPNPNNFYGHGIEEIEFASPLDSLISRPRMASPVNSVILSPLMSPESGLTAGESTGLWRLKQWLIK